VDYGRFVLRRPDVPPRHGRSDRWLVDWTTSGSFARLDADDDLSQHVGEQLDVWVQLRNCRHGKFAKARAPIERR